MGSYRREDFICCGSRGEDPGWQKKKKNQENKNSREIKVEKIEAGGRESMGPGRVGGI